MNKAYPVYPIQQLKDVAEVTFAFAISQCYHTGLIAVTGFDSAASIL